MVCLAVEENSWLNCICYAPPFFLRASGPFNYTPNMSQHGPHAGLHAGSHAPHDTAAE